MTGYSSNNKRRWGWIRPSKRALAGVFFVAVVAFFLGGRLQGGASEPQEVRAVASGESAAAPAAELWTCSMHPQIKLPKPGKCPICFMDLIPLESSGGEELGPRQIRMSETAAQLAQIQTSPVIRSFAEHEVRMVGEITYDETTEAYITAWVPGRLDRLFVDYTGVTVKKGEHMVHMYSPELVAAQEELLQAKASVSALANTSSEILRSTARATLAAAREKLRLLGLTEEQISGIESSGKSSDHLTIYAPIGGVVMQKNALEGMYVDTGTRIYTIADLSRLWVKFKAYESDLPWLHNGQSVQFTLPSFPGEKFRASISFIDPVVNTKTRTVDVRAIVDNKSLRLKPGMFVSGVLSSRVEADGASSESGKEAPLLIPASAPLITGTRAVVYVQIPNDEWPLFEGREVILGPRAGDFYVVKSGLEEGEMVVTNGAFKIDSELQIQAKPSMMSSAGETGSHTGEPVARQDESGVSAGKATERKAESARPASAAMSDQTPEESSEVRRALDPVYEAYLEVQGALAEDDLPSAKGAAGALERAASKVDTELFSQAGHEIWMKALSALKSAAVQITDAGDIAEARDGFFCLSNAVIDLHRSFGHDGGSAYYLTFCPMARDNEGAYWLQADSTVSNPYYGKAMLRCGDIKEVLPSGDGGRSRS